MGAEAAVAAGVTYADARFTTIDEHAGVVTAQRRANTPDAPEPSTGGDGSPAKRGKTVPTSGCASKSAPYIQNGRASALGAMLMTDDTTLNRPRRAQHPPGPRQPQGSPRGARPTDRHRPPPHLPLGNRRPQAERAEPARSSPKPSTSPSCGSTRSTPRHELAGGHATSWPVRPMVAATTQTPCVPVPWSGPSTPSALSPPSSTRAPPARCSRIRDAHRRCPMTARTRSCRNARL